MLEELNCLILIIKLSTIQFNESKTQVKLKVFKSVYMLVLAEGCIYS